MKNIFIVLLTLLAFYSCKEAKKEAKIPIQLEKPKPVFLFGYNLDDYNVVHDTIESGESFGVILVFFLDNINLKLFLFF